MSDAVRLPPTAYQGVVLTDLLAGSWAREAALLAGGVAALAASAQIAIPLSFTPVPITGQTFAVMLVGSSYGLARAVTAMITYLLVGLVGAPVFSPDPKTGHARTGEQLLHSPSLGYILGMLAAMALLGWLSQHAWDRRLGSATAQMITANLLIYAVGVPWLAHSAHLSTTLALTKGLLPFLIGDGLKIVLAAALLPATWRRVPPQPQIAWGALPRTGPAKNTPDHEVTPAPSVGVAGAVVPWFSGVLLFNGAWEGFHS
jgi:biotin transport system substrate-specific component